MITDQDNKIVQNTVDYAYGEGCDKIILEIMIEAYNKQYEERYDMGGGYGFVPWNDEVPVDYEVIFENPIKLKSEVDISQIRYVNTMKVTVNFLARYCHNFEWGEINEETIVQMIKSHLYLEIIKRIDVDSSKIGDDIFEYIRFIVRKYDNGN